MSIGKPTKPSRRPSLAALATLAVAWACGAPLAQPAETDAATGKRIFDQKCAACHSVGEGDRIGPDLQGVTGKRPREWLQRWMAAPDRMLAAGDPIATALLHQYRDVPMPNLQLGASEIAALLAYLETSAPDASVQPPSPVGAGAASSQSSSPASPARVPAARGVADIGKNLFTGVLRFRNGGPPCMGCHSVAGIGALGGGRLGPDLTTVATRFGGATAIDAYIAASPTSVMNTVWPQKPLTNEERAHVVAFLGQAPLAQRPVQSIWELAALAVLGLALLLAIAGWIWRGRLREVRRPMIAGRRPARRAGSPANARGRN